MLSGKGDVRSGIAARAITDSQRNLPYGTGIQNRVGAVRHAIVTSLTFIVLSGVFFAVPNWGLARTGNGEGIDRLNSRITGVEKQLSILINSFQDTPTVEHRIVRQLQNMRRELGQLRSAARQSSSCGAARSCR
jgi:hypothetical protein